MEEIWKPVPIEGLKEKYEVSNLGNVRRVQHATASSNEFGGHIRHYCTRNLRPHYNKLGYVRFTFTIKNTQQHTFSAHRLVAQAFLPNPNNLPVVDHIDTNPSNNVVSNLRWCTHSENNLNPITRARSSAARMGNKYGLGWHPNEEQRLKLHNALLGRKVSQETREKLRLAHLGKEATEKQKYSNAQRVAQFSKSGEYIKTWRSASDAARGIGVTRAAITNAANPKDYHKTSGGFVWEYV